MDQKKIGKFIAQCRKQKNMTQQELAERLNVSDRTIGNWENGRNMPDLSMFKPLCDELGISINDLMSGEKVLQEDYQEKLEENIVTTIEYTNRKLFRSEGITIWMIAGGLFLSFSALSVFPDGGSWSSIYAILGNVISAVGVFRITRKRTWLKRGICCFAYFSIWMVIWLTIDCLRVVFYHQAPKFSYHTETIYNMIIYKTPMYHVYRINYDSPNEYYIIDTDRIYTADTVPNTPFNRTYAGIDNLLRYKSAYVGDNSNDAALIQSLPLNEYGFVFEIDSEGQGLYIHYYVTDWYINENAYLEKSLLYNSVAIFSLIDNAAYIQYDFSGSSYRITREQVEEYYPNYEKIVKDGVHKENFNRYLENKMNDREFVEQIFLKLFS